MKIGQKLALGFFIAVLCIWVTAFFAINTLINVHKEFVLLKCDIVPGTILMVEMDKKATEIVHLLMQYINFGNEQYMYELESAMEELKKQGLIHIEHESHIGLKEHIVSYELQNDIDRFIASVENIIDLKQRGVVVDQLTNTTIVTVYPMLDDLNDKYNKHKEFHLKELSESVEAVTKAYSSGMKILLVLVLIITFLSVIISILITRSIIKPIQNLNKGAEIIGNGNLDYKIGNQSKDEIGQLSRTFDEMSEKLMKSTTSVVNFNREIAERINTEKELKESEDRFCLLMEQVPSIAVRASKLDGTILYWSHGNEIIYQYTKEEALGKNVLNLIIPPEMHEIVKQSTIKAAEVGKAPEPTEMIMIRKDGSRVPVFCSNVIIQRPGQEVEMFCIDIDLSELKRAKEEYGRLIMAIEQAAETVVITDTEGLIQYVNPAFEQITGYTQDEALGKNPSILKSGEHDSAFYKGMWDTLTSGKTWRGRLINKRKDEIIYTEEAAISPVKDASGKIVNYVGVKRDITKDIKMEEQLQQSQKMEAIGTLAGGIAHDFNNILFPIFGYTEMIMSEVPEDSAIRKKLNIILNGAMRAKSLVQQILTFSRQNKQELKPLMIQLVINEALKLFKAALPSTIEIIQNIDESCGLIMADYTQIHQIMMNLCANAFHSMEETGGKLEICLKEIEIKSGDILEINIKPGKYALLTVSDTGCGMEQKVIERIFEPYFTTKESEKGTGLGLSVVHGIVKKYGGEITVQSKLMKGSTFNIYLPMIDTPKNETIIEDHKFQKGKGERILLIDDEKMIISVEKDMLELLGYNVTPLTDSKEALKIFKTQPDNFDVIITDRTMPGLTGYQLAAEVIKIRKGIPIILCSGFSDKVSDQELEDLGIKAILSKPITIYKFSKVVSDVLNKN